MLMITALLAKRKRRIAFFSMKFFDLNVFVQEKYDYQQNLTSLTFTLSTSFIHKEKVKCSFQRICPSYNSWKYQKTRGFLKLSEGIENTLRVKPISTGHFQLAATSDYQTLLAGATWLECTAM